MVLIPTALPKFVNAQDSNPPPPRPSPPLTRGVRAGCGGIRHAQKLADFGCAIGTTARPCARQSRPIRAIWCGRRWRGLLPSPPAPLPLRGRGKTRANTFGVLKRALQRQAEAALPHSIIFGVLKRELQPNGIIPIATPGFTKTASSLNPPTPAPSPSFSRGERAGVRRDSKPTHLRTLVVRLV